MTTGRPPTPLRDRFWPRVRKGAGCWLWLGGVDSDGYGQIAVKAADGHRTSARAHRIAWELTHGPVPAGLCVLHRCDNPPCVRPDHLFLGTPTDNNHDMLAKGRERPPVGVEHGMARLTEEQAREIRRRVAAGESRRAVAALMGVHYSHACSVARGARWKHLTS